jgi:hypothetical protein
VKPSRKPQRGIVDTIVYAPASGRLAELRFAEVATRDGERVIVDVDAAVGETVAGPEETFATVLGEVSVIAKDVRHAREIAARVLRYPPVVEPAE